MSSTRLSAALWERDVIWQLGDIGAGITARINAAVLIILCPIAFKDLKDFERNEKM